MLFVLLASPNKKETKGFSNDWQYAGLPNKTKVQDCQREEKSENNHKVLSQFISPQNEAIKVSFLL